MLKQHVAKRYVLALCAAAALMKVRVLRKLQRPSWGRFCGCTHLLGSGAHGRVPVQQQHEQAQSLRTVQALARRVPCPDQVHQRAVRAAPRHWQLPLSLTSEPLSWPCTSLIPLGNALLRPLAAVTLQNLAIMLLHHLKVHQRNFFPAPQQRQLLLALTPQHNVRTLVDQKPPGWTGSI